MDRWISALDPASFDKSEILALDSLSLKLSFAVAAIQAKTGILRPKLDDQAWRASEDLRSEAQSAITNILENKTLKNSATFRRNISTIFVGPERSEFDSSVVQARKDVTQKRCERLRKLSSDGIVCWAVSYTPTSWTTVSSSVFDCLIDDIEPNDALPWPAAVTEILQRLKGTTALQNSREYEQFFNGDSVFSHSREYGLTCFRHCSSVSNR